MYGVRVRWRCKKVRMLKYHQEKQFQLLSVYFIFLQAFALHSWRNILFNDIMAHNVFFVYVRGTNYCQNKQCKNVAMFKIPG
jgi:hypothetical protein